MFKLINTAPIKYSESFGPVLGWGSRAPETEPPHCEVIVWNGQEWSDGALTPFYPTHWEVLPDDPSNP